MPKRKSISKKLRFELFKRDGFTCQYCGSAPPSVILEIDHIHPVSKGGDNSEENLITACFDCNRGKTSNSLSSIPNTLIEKSETIKEKEEQLAGLKKLNKQVKARKTRNVNQLEKALKQFYPDSRFTAVTKKSIKNQFLTKLDIDTLIDNIETACCYIDDDPQQAYKYFCGICWNIIRENNDA